VDGATVEQSPRPLNQTDRRFETRDDENGFICILGFRLVVQDLSKTLRAILTQPGLPAPLGNSLIVFDRPADSFNPLQTTVDLFLYDMRENLDLRSNEIAIDKSGTQYVTHPAPLRLACSYLVTAWPVGGADLALQEHQLLSQVLQALAKFPTIPPGFLQGSLTSQVPPLPMVALHPDALKNLSEFWTSLGNKLRASLTLTVTISMPVFDDIADFPVTTHTTNTTSLPGTDSESWIQIGGQVFDQSNAGVAGALVDLTDAGLRALTDTAGRFTFERVSVGAHNLQVVAAGFQPNTKALVVPGRPEDYEVTLTPL
jgi:Pvc16 N-terminal domain/Carboxypeptidase regulatory-like domain